jgi:hypothetical protein
MARNSKLTDAAKPVVNLGRHQRNCTVCQHEQKEEIETAFVAWRSPASLAEEFGLADRTSVYRHAHALGLFAKRQRNVRAALERIIEKAGEVDVTASAVVSAIQAYTKINAAGQWVDRSEQVNMNDLFDRMSTRELEEYAQNGTLPGWFEAATAGATRTQTRLLPATGAGIRPGDYALGSDRSRAAARLLLDEQAATREPGLLLRVEVMANPSPATRCSCKVPPFGQFAICKCFMPSAITRGLL